MPRRLRSDVDATCSSAIQNLGVRVNTLTPQDQQGPCYGTAKAPFSSNPGAAALPTSNTTSSLHGHVQHLKPSSTPSRKTCADFWCHGEACSPTCCLLLLHGAPPIHLLAGEPSRQTPALAGATSSAHAQTLPSEVRRPYSRNDHSQPALTGADFQHAVRGEARAQQLAWRVVEAGHQQDDLARKVRQRGRVPARLLLKPRYTHY